MTNCDRVANVMMEQMESRQLMSTTLGGTELSGSDSGSQLLSESTTSGVNVALADGSVRFLSYSVPTVQLKLSLKLL